MLDASSCDTSSSVIEVTLLGQFTVSRSGFPATCVGSRRAQELAAFLLVQNGRPVERDVLADRLWGDHAGDVRKLLRQSLWNLRQTFAVLHAAALLRADDTTIAIPDDAPLDVDARYLEQAQERAHGVQGADLSDVVRDDMVRAVDRYRGDFLPCCYENWSVIERERYRAIYLALLDKLLHHAEAHGRHEDGLRFGELILANDAASERTHRTMMRLRHGSGDRTGALRQFERCCAALESELGVVPSQITVDLADAIRHGDAPADARDHARHDDRTQELIAVAATGRRSGTAEATVHLTRVRRALADASEQARRAQLSLSSAVD